jgi:opacity protein-like surface antigen
MLHANQLKPLFNPQLYPKFNFIAFGFSNNMNTQSYHSDIGYMLEMGAKLNSHKIYISFPVLLFSNSSNELDLTIASINYDYIYYNKKRYKPYIGTGINYIDIIQTNINTQQEDRYTKIGINLKTGFMYELNYNWDINFGLNYLYINHDLIKNTYGSFINIEYNF